MRRAALLALALLGCGHGASTPCAPSVVLVTIDTWRADHLDHVLTPNIEALAQQGWRFEHAWSPIGLTSPAHATLLSGLTPAEHGMRANNHQGGALPWTVTTLAEHARKSGWRTAAFVSAYPAGPAGGLDQGFEVFDGPEAGERPGDLAITRARGWLGTVPRSASSLLWVHLYEPHGPYTPPDEDARAVGASAGERDRYAAEVHAADRLLGPLLDDARSRGAFVAVTADHGEVLDEEVCAWQHERTIHEAVLRVPLILAGPGLEPAVREEWVGLHDVAPTLAALAGLPPWAGRSGRSLVTPGEGRSSWLAESGLCEPDCAPGCAPTGLGGRDRVLIGPTWRVVDRPGRGSWAEGVGAPLPEGWSVMFAPLPRFDPPPEPTDPDSQEATRALGYTP
ncbi:MAG: sulfatase [Pseudomonadota bacterium]